MVASDFNFIFINKKIINDTLKLHSKILNLEIYNDVERTVFKTTANAEMEIVNQTDGKVTLLNPRFFSQSNTKNFALTEIDNKHQSPIWTSSSSSDEPIISEEFNKTIMLLAEQRPVENLILKLEPGEKTKWNEKIYFEFDATEKKKRWEEINWQEFRKKSDTFWLSFSYYLPEETYLLKPKLVEILPECWNCAGSIPLYCYKHQKTEMKVFTINTEPIFVDFNQAKIIDNK